MTTLEELLSERRAIIESLQDMQAHPNDSYDSRKNLGAISNHDDPIAVPDPREYLNKESVLNNNAKKALKKREDGIKNIVKSDISEYISNLKDEEIAHLALQLDKEFQELASAGNDPGKMQDMIVKYASKPELCMDLISTAYNPQEALQRTYAALVDVKAKEIENKNKLYTIVEDGKKLKKVYNRKNAEQYLMKNLESSEDKIKDSVYLAIAEGYCNKN